MILPGGAHEADRKIGAGRIERIGAGEGAHRLGAEVHRAPRQAAAEVLELAVAPRLGLADRVGRGGREERRLGHQLLQPGGDRERAVDGLAVDHDAGDGRVARAVDRLHRLPVAAGLEDHALVLEALEAQRGLGGHARMRRGEHVDGDGGRHAPHPPGWRRDPQPARVGPLRPRGPDGAVEAWSPPATHPAPKRQLRCTRSCGASSWRTSKSSSCVQTKRSWTSAVAAMIASIAPAQRRWSRAAARSFASSTPTASS